jgi:ADP-ribosyl-[dinitrogen reductase] hydrolase
MSQGLSLTTVGWPVESNERDDSDLQLRWVSGSVGPTCFTCGSSGSSRDSGSTPFLATGGQKLFAISPCPRPAFQTFSSNASVWPISDIRRKFGPAGIQEPSLTDGKLVVSDYTQMTLFTLEGILKGLDGPSPSTETLVESIRLPYLGWPGTQGEGHRNPPKSKGWLAQCPEMQVQRAAGRTCLASLMCGGHGTIKEHLNDSKGCGGAMRSAPVGLFRCFDPKQSFELGARSAAITHGHPSGYLSAGMVSAIVRCLMDGMDIHAATEESLQTLKGCDGHEETLHAVTKALRSVSGGSKDHPTAIHSIGGGWVGEEALAIALHSVLAGGSYVEAVRIASNHDGDSDSTASIVGQIWGAWKGLTEIPHGWITKLDVLVPALRLAREALDSSSLV